jgi:hypothetical protein
MGKKAESFKVPVSMRALIQRINRKLAPDDKRLKKMRSERWRSEVGEYFIVDVNRNMITDKHVDPKELGRELGVLGLVETVVES